MTSTVLIYPSGFGGKPVELEFSSEEERQAYIKAERRYDIEEFIAYSGARQKVDRDRARDAWLKKRVDFAKKVGFVPSKTIAFRWRLDPRRKIEPPKSVA